MLAVLIVLAAVAQTPHIKVKEESPGLLKKARITVDSAYALATRRVAGGRAPEAELEMEDGRLVYSFDLKIAGKAGVEEVLVDAISGAVVSVQHETPAAEARHARRPPAG